MKSNVTTQLMHHLYYSPWSKRIVRRLARSRKPGSVVKIPFGALRHNLWPIGANQPSCFWLGIYELAVQEVLVDYLKPRQVFYDIGANCGFFSLLGAQQVTQQGQVFAFEPDTDCLSALHTSIDINHIEHVHVIAQAVSNCSGRAAFVKGNSASTSRLISSMDEIDAKNTLSNVMTTTLDEFIQLHPAPDIIKIDIEGAEVQALEGAQSLMDGPSPPIWLVETHGPECKRFVTDTLCKANYTVLEIEESTLLSRRNHHLLGLPLGSTPGKH
ncbi:MAG: FkbM family methyltransferase [Anaerolineae bacterium]|nr:FkbM family methyltransferase [Anaerolineae bacterium]